MTSLEAQILNGTIDPNWVLVALSSIVSFFVIRTLIKIEKKIEQYGERIENHEVRITVMEQGD
jgi:hypothetical protein